MVFVDRCISPKKRDSLMAEWFDPGALDGQQEEARGTAIDELRPSGDFSSYAIANRGAGLAASGVDGHNLIYATHRVAQYAHVLGGRSFDRIADIGCGLGLTTNALAQRYPGAEVVGLEVSTDAVEFAQKNFKQAQFMRMAIGPSVPLPGSYDLILCQEFYPFTRTGERETHRAYIEYFLTHLRPGGVLLIELNERDRDKGILATIDKLGFPAEIKSLPFDRVYRNMPVFIPALAASMILTHLLSRTLNKCVLIRKRV